ncbi:MAG: hypothetical protein PUC90_02935 [Prevotella sp.]|nr:hypothetical protein [Prevotella sp.]
MKKISLQTKLEDCFVPKRFIDVIRREAEDIRTIFDLVSLTRREFLRIEFVGQRCLSVWDEFLEQYGLCIGMTVKEILQYEPDKIIQYEYDLESEKLHSKLILPFNCNPESNIDRSKREKFDPKTLKPLDTVIVRSDDKCRWFLDSFSYVYPDSICVCTGGCDYKQCIPYNEDTKHLVGTTEEAPEFYRYWED